MEKLEKTGCGRTIHPTVFKINGFNIKVAAFCELDDEKALELAMIGMKVSPPNEKSKVGSKPFTLLVNYP